MPPKKTPSAATSAAKKVTAKTILPKKAAATPKQAAAKKTAPPKQRGAFYVSFASVGATISAAKPKGVKSPPAFDTFEQAKAAAIDALVDAIEAAEANLLVLKRAQGPGDLGG